MANAKHTPAPWAVQVDGDGDFDATGADGMVIVQVLDCDDRSEPDARLIAAAPELLEALREASTDLLIAANNARHAAKTDQRWEGVAEKLMARREQCEAAIAKAEGRE